MGAFEKFVSADKLFWESSKTEIQKISGIYINNEGGYQVALKRYYQEYSIDIFDKKNIEKFFNMYPITTGRLHKNFRIINLELKEIQKTTDDYVTDFLSYQKCLNNYYERHGADTEWLVKIFAERYDLERFNISPEDVLDDLHKIMKGKPMFPSLKEMSLNGTEVSPTEELYQDNDFEDVGSSLANYNNNLILEKNVLKEINKLQITFDYKSNVSAYKKTVVGACGSVVRGVLDQCVLSHTVNQLKLTLNAKRQRNKTEYEYNECLENNIIFNLYEYDCFLKILNFINNSTFDLENIDLDSYYSLVVEDAQRKIPTAKQFSVGNKAVQQLLMTYARKDTENKEFDYIFSSLKAMIIRDVLKTVLFGEVESRGVSTSLKTYFQQFPIKDIIATFDFVITHEIATRLNNLY